MVDGLQVHAFMKISTLSDNQREILEIIASHIKVNGESPSLRDIMKKASKINSLRGVAIQLNALEKANYISRSSKAKSIQINNHFWDNEDKLISIPLFTGSLQAGLPSFFDEHSDSTIPAKLSDTKGLKDIYAFKINGQSMIDKNIEEGDYAIVTELVNPNSGDIVVALTDEGITLKIYRVIDGHHMLFPANKNFKPITDNFEVRGKLVNIIKPKTMNEYRRLLIQ